MLNPLRLTRLVAAEEFDRLLNEVLMNGRAVSLSVRLRLSSEEGLGACALGLALRRLTELSWSLEPAALAVSRRLAGMQAEDGSFGSVAATACAVGGLGALRAQLMAASQGGWSESGPLTRGTDGALADSGAAGDDPEAEWRSALAAIDSAWRRGLEWLRVRTPRFRGHRLDRAEFDRHRGVALRSGAWGADEAVDAAVVLWQLGHDLAALDEMGIEDVSAAVDALGLRHHRETASLVEGLTTRRSRADGRVQRVPAPGPATVGGGVPGAAPRGPWRAGASTRRAA